MLHESDSGGSMNFIIKLLLLFFKLIMEHPGVLEGKAVS
jgi:hypothetical protein